MRTKIIKGFAETRGGDAISGASSTVHEQQGSEPFSSQMGLGDAIAEEQATTPIADTDGDFSMVRSNIVCVFY